MQILGEFFCELIIDARCHNCSLLVENSRALYVSYGILSNRSGILHWRTRPSAHRGMQAYDPECAARVVSVIQRIGFKDELQTSSEPMFPELAVVQVGGPALQIPHWGNEAWCVQDHMIGLVVVFAHAKNMYMQIIVGPWRYRKKRWCSRWFIRVRESSEECIRQHL